MKIEIPSEQVQTVIDEFFVKDRGLTPNGLIRNSTLLACHRDFLFLRGVKLEYPPYSLNREQSNAIRDNLPSFAVILVYCSAIDLVARVMHRSTGNGKSKKYFIRSAKRWFGLNSSQCNALWKLRCAMSHQYMIEKDQRTVPFGFNGSMMYDKKLRKWVFNLNGMYGDMRRAKEAAYLHINSKSDRTKKKYANFIYEYGFFYTHAD